MKDLLRAGVVGVGHFGRHHARVYSELDDVELVGVFDVDRERARTVAGELRTAAFDDLAGLLDRVDVVSVAVPTCDHAAVSAQALERGVSVLVEKPMAATLEEAVALRETARRSEAKLQVGHIMRFNPVVAAVHEMHIEPKFLETQRLSPFSFRSLDVGVVLDMMIHDIDLVLQLTSGGVERVDAVGCAIVGDVEDMCNARIAFDDGAVANLTASRTSLKTLRRARVFSTGAYISMDFVANTGLIIRRSEKWSTDTVDMEKLRELSVDQLRQVMTDGLFTVQEMKLDETEPLRAELASFVDCVRNGRAPVVG
ncbi:MAG TPA: Gfo/Idh/MocA family oxidoreductase, partial [Planctomycetota bacterium]|nr:Gfo/Idh/MocA family oxidoreductase [Planctomycetota bacterium]